MGLIVSLNQNPYKQSLISKTMAGESMPLGFGGLMRYNEEYDSKFKFGPSAVIAMIIAVIIFTVSLGFFF